MPQIWAAALPSRAPLPWPAADQGADQLAALAPSVALAQVGLSQQALVAPKAALAELFESL